MTTILLLRHGETDAVGKMLMGWTPGWHLNRAGKSQAERLAQRLSRLPVRAVYSSPLERALETAGIVASPHGATPVAVDELGEMRLGSWEGKAFAELDHDRDWRRFNEIRSVVRPPGGELMIEVQVRMVRQLECLHQRHLGEMVAVVSHGDPLRAVVAFCLGIPLDALLRFEIGLASVSVLEYGEYSPRVLCINETGEVPL